MENVKMHSAEQHNLGSKHFDKTLGWCRKKAILLIVIILIAVAGVALYKEGTSWWADRAIKTSEYQAVFLTNNQVYFGKISGITKQYVKIKNIYYLQVPQQAQGSSSGSTTSTTQPSLVKLGSEIHGPEDIMYVARNQVLFWENLKNDGKVAQAIKNYQTSNKK